MKFKQQNFKHSNLKPVISLKIEGTFLDTKSEITLFEEISDKSKSYYFEMRSDINSQRIGKKVLSMNEVQELFDFVRELKLENNPDYTGGCDGAWICLKIFNNYYEWMTPFVPKEWEPLEEIVSKIEELSGFEEFREECWNAIRFEWLSVINLKKHHVYSLQKGFVVYRTNMEPAGMFYRIGEAREFVKVKDIWLELEREPYNSHDANAIKVMGCSRELPELEKRHIGYLPREIAEIIVRLNISNHIKLYLHRTYYDFRTNTVIVNFDLAGPVEKWKEFKETLQTAEYA